MTPSGGWCTTRPTFSGGSGNLSQTAQSAEDLSEEQVNQIIDQVQEAIRSIVKAPRRLAKRATKQVVDFEANLENYLRNTNKKNSTPRASEICNYCSMIHEQVGKSR